MLGTINRGNFGLTRSKADYDAVVAWRDSAIADGWSHEASYPPTEGEDRACKLQRDGYIVRVISRTARTAKENFPYEAEVHGYSPDGLALRLPNTYDWNAIQAAAQICQYCKGPIAGKPYRVGFAGRACLACGPIEQKKLPQNWCD